MLKLAAIAIIASSAIMGAAGDASAKGGGGGGRFSSHHGGGHHGHHGHHGGGHHGHHGQHGGHFGHRVVTGYAGVASAPFVPNNQECFTELRRLNGALRHVRTCTDPYR